MPEVQHGEMVLSCFICLPQPNTPGPSMFYFMVQVLCYRASKVTNDQFKFAPLRLQQLSLFLVLRDPATQLSSRISHIPIEAFVIG